MMMSGKKWLLAFGITFYSATGIGASVDDANAGDGDVVVDDAVVAYEKASILKGSLFKQDQQRLLHKMLADAREFAFTQWAKEFNPNTYISEETIAPFFLTNKVAFEAMAANIKSAHLSGLVGRPTILSHSFEMNMGKSEVSFGLFTYIFKRTQNRPPVVTRVDLYMKINPTSREAFSEEVNIATKRQIKTMVRIPQEYRIQLVDITSEPRSDILVQAHAKHLLPQPAMLQTYANVVSGGHSSAVIPPPRAPLPEPIRDPVAPKEVLSTVIEDVAAGSVAEEDANDGEIVEAEEAVGSDEVPGPATADELVFIPSYDELAAVQAGSTQDGAGSATNPEKTIGLAVTAQQPPQEQAPAPAPASYGYYNPLRLIYGTGSAAPTAQNSVERPAVAPLAVSPDVVSAGPAPVAGPTDVVGVSPQVDSAVAVESAVSAHPESTDSVQGAGPAAAGTQPQEQAPAPKSWFSW